MLPATAPGGRGSQEVAVASGSVVRAAPTARETGSEDSIEGVDSGADNGKIDQLPPLRFISDNGGPADGLNASTLPGTLVHFRGDALHSWTVSAKGGRRGGGGWLSLAFLLP